MTRIARYSRLAAMTLRLMRGGKAMISNAPPYCRENHGMPMKSLALAEGGRRRGRRAMRYL